MENKILAKVNGNVITEKDLNNAMARFQKKIKNILEQNKERFNF